jgi:threonine dehydrogenase-like Zn-dependent dehydrogenase
MCGPRLDLVGLVQLVGDGRIEPVIDSRYPMSDAARAEARLAARERYCKIVLVPDSLIGTGPRTVEGAAAVPAPS